MRDVSADQTVPCDSFTSLPSPGSSTSVTGNLVSRTGTPGGVKGRRWGGPLKDPGATRSRSSDESTLVPGPEPEERHFVPTGSPPETPECVSQGVVSSQTGARKNGDGSFRDLKPVTESARRV